MYTDIGNMYGGRSLYAGPLAGASPTSSPSAVPSPYITPPHRGPLIGGGSQTSHPEGKNNFERNRLILLYNKAKFSILKALKKGTFLKLRIFEEIGIFYFISKNFHLLEKNPLEIGIHLFLPDFWL